MKKIITAAAMLALMAAPAFAKTMHDDAHIKAMVDDKFSMMDTNSDGMISKDEHDAAMTKMFNDADTNGDGMISKDEMTAEVKKEMAKYKSDKMSAPVSNNTKTNKTPK